MTETLYTYPKCGRANFTARGLTAHRCKPVTTLMAKNTPTTSIVTLDFGRAREHARAVEQSANQALWHAIQCGLELIRLKATQPELRGGTAAGGRNPHAAGFPSWDDLVRQEVGISDDTARRWMLLAKGALKELETEPQAFLALPEPKREKTLQQVETLAGQYATQQDFIRKLFGVKPPLGAGLAESGRQGGNQHGKGKKDKTPKPMDPKLEADTLKKGINKDISDILNGKKKLWLHLSRTDMEVLQAQAKTLHEFMSAVLKGGHQ